MSKKPVHNDCSTIAVPVEKGINIIVYVYVPCADHNKPFKTDEFPTKSIHEKWVTSKVCWVLDWVWSAWVISSIIATFFTQSELIPGKS